MPLILEPKSDLTLAIEVDTVGWDNVATMTAAELANLPVQHGNRQVAIGDLFTISGSADEDETVIWRGDCARVKRIGQGLSRGVVRIEGNAGDHVGAEMTGGRVEVTGNAGHFAGAEMKGGSLVIGGNAGNSLGSVYRGAHKGMRGGEIFVAGNAGHEVGHAMRRGLIAVRGDVGDAAGFKMLAGSILLFGAAGEQLGAGMKRGSIVCFSPCSVARLLPTFIPASTWRPLFLRFYLDQLRGAGWTISPELYQAEFTRYCGDFAAMARGEILFAKR